MHMSCAVITTTTDRRVAVGEATDMFEEACIGCECGLPECEECAHGYNPFYDWYVVGGRWEDTFSGKHIFTVKEALENLELSKNAKAQIKTFLPWHMMIFSYVRQTPEGAIITEDWAEKYSEDTWEQALLDEARINSEDNIIVVIDYHN